MPGLAGRPAFVRAEIGDGVIDVDGSADRGGVGKHIGRVAQQQLLTEAGRDLIAIHWGVSGGQVDDRFQIDGAALAEQQA